jgi:hypothetical protein
VSSVGRNKAGEVCDHALATSPTSSSSQVDDLLLPRHDLAIRLLEASSDMLEEDLCKARRDSISNLLQNGRLAAGELMAWEEGLQRSKLAQLERALASWVQVAVTAIASDQTPERDIVLVGGLVSRD